MTVQRNSEDRAAMLADRAAEQRRRVPRFTPVPAKARFSTRGERAQTWRTKAWTPARWRDLQALDAAGPGPNFHLLSMLDDRIMPSVARLKAHLAANPNDTAAKAALYRAEA